MTTRDSRSRFPNRPDTRTGRDPTQSLSIPPEESSHPSLALGTHDAGREERTKVDSPQARSKPPTHDPQHRAARSPSHKPPPIPAKKSGEDPDERIDSVLGSYRVLELLGKGGMGYVFRAEHTKLGREVALKLLRSD